MMSPSRASSFIEPILKILFIIFIVHFVYDWLTRDTEDDDDTVTITFRCKQVLDIQNQYPEFVIKQCKELKR